ncbi:MAG: MATE family efflux transporter [Clostridiales bacterium]|jgi:putative MATE family efflux protein|nr:MATE family efflux transporter [Clostridiales bacterium]
MNATDKLSETEKLMAQADLRKLVLRYSVPTIIGMLVNALYNVVDRFWVGRLPGETGLYGLTGIGLCMSQMVLALGFSQLSGVGAASRISIALGVGDRKRAEQILGNALTLCLITATASTILQYVFATQILMLIGADEHTLPYATDYLNIVLAGCFVQITGLALNHCIRSTGNPKRFASTQVLGAVVNAVLDPVLIYGFHMGIKGAAYATVASQILSAAWVISYYFHDNSTLHFRLPNLRLKPEIVRQIVSIGSAAFFTQVMGSVTWVFANRTLKRYGDLEYLGGGTIAITAATVIQSVNTLVTMPVIGINQGMQPIIGFNFGMKNYERAKKAFWWAMIYATVVCVAGFVLIQTRAPSLIHIFNDDDGLVAMGVSGLKIMLCTISLAGVYLLAPVFFQAIGRAKLSIVLIMLRQAALIIPLLIVMPTFFGLNGVWMAQPISDVTITIVSVILLKREFRIFKKINAEKAGDNQTA